MRENTILFQNKSFNFFSFDLEGVIYDPTIQKINDTFIKIKQVIDTKSIPRCIATGASLNEIDIINKTTGLYKIIPKNMIFSCHALGYKKNNPKFFSYISSFFPYSNKIHIDDGANGIIGAQYENFTTVYIGNDTKIPSDYSYQTLSDFYSLLS